MAQSNGGVSTTSRLTLFPMQSVIGAVVGFYAFDPSAGFDDQNAGGFYSFKVEEVLAGRKPTIGQAIITYRDLGVASISLFMSGVTENQAVITQAVSASIGNAVATGKLMTKVVGINFPACFNPQLTIIRNPAAGPVSIAKVVLCGRVEVAQEFA